MAVDFSCRVLLCNFKKRIQENESELTSITLFHKHPCISAIFFLPFSPKSLEKRHSFKDNENAVAGHYAGY